MSMWSKIKSKIQKRYVAFFTVVPLLLLLAVVQAPCPVCDGSGNIYNNRMGQVAIVSVDSSLRTVGTIEGCVNYIIYTYDVVLTMENHGEVLDASGYVRLGLVDYTTNTLMGSQYTLVEVPASSLVQTFTTTQFVIGLDSPRTTAVTAEIALGDSDCQACGGKGSVAFNNVPLINGMKKSFAEVQLVGITPFLPPPINEDLAHEQDAQMYNTEQWILENPEVEE